MGPGVIEFFIWLGLLVGAYVLSQWVVQLRLKRACDHIMRDLEEKGAIDPESATPLPYERTPLINLGLRDMRPKALEYLLIAGLLGRTKEGRYYLLRGPRESGLFNEGSGRQ